MMREIFNLIMISTFTIFFASCSKNNGDIILDNKTEKLGSETEIIDKEKATLNYRNHCGGCHGQNSASFVERQWKYGYTLEALQNSIKNVSTTHTLLE